MDLTQALLKLPVEFSADALAAEVAALPQSAWEPHPTGFVGNDAVRLVSPGGEPTDALRGTMAATEHLLRSPYLMEVMGWLGGTWGRSRLMGLGVGAEVPPHVDCHYYWRTHLRIHIPVITNLGVEFTCGEETVHMKPGECWVFDSFRRHEVHNRGTEKRVHLVLDTVGSARLWDLIDAAQSGVTEATAVNPGIGQQPLVFETLNAPKVMSPWEMQVHLEFIGSQLGPAEAAASAVMRRMSKFVTEWTALWVQYETRDEGLPAYRSLSASVQHDLAALRGEGIRLINNTPLYFAMQQLIFLNAIERPPAHQLRAATHQSAARNVA